MIVKPGTFHLPMLYDMRLYVYHGCFYVKNVENIFSRIIAYSRGGAEHRLSPIK